MKKTALTFIHGNRQEELPRFLESFEGLCDIKVAVRACGSAEPDDSQRLCAEAGCITGEYVNARNPEWDHVDDYASARNMALDMAVEAGAEWIVWADTDDVIDERSKKTLRSAIDAADKKGAGIVLADYRVPEDNVTVKRERAWKAGAARWWRPIHECLKPVGDPEAFAVQNCTFLHAPACAGNRRHKDRRNLTILESIPEDDRTCGDRFHMFQSLRALGRIDEAVEIAHALLLEEDIGTPEKYELLVALGQIAEPGPARKQYFLQAVAADPSRREAYGELALSSISDGKSRDALGWVHSMLAHQCPREWAWNARRKYYNWLGEQLHGAALRACGRIQQADVIEANWFAAHDGVISLLHASRGRPEKAWRTRAMWLDRASNADAVEHIFALDANDDDAPYLSVCRHIYVSGNGGPVEAWNVAASRASGKLLVQLSDDWVPPFGWDKLLLDAIGDRINAEAVIAVSDGHRTDDLLCMAICTRQRLKAQGGHLFHPAFHSMYSDNHFSEQAWKSGVVIDARDRIVFEHQHPAFGAGEWDETYKRTNAPERYEEGKRIFWKLQRSRK